MPKQWCHGDRGEVNLIVSGPPLSRRDLEDLWRERMQIARIRYRIARDACSDAMARQPDAAPPDGSFGYTQALRAANAALAEYRRLLIIFNDLVINGKMPPAE